MKNGAYDQSSTSLWYQIFDSNNLFIRTSLPLQFGKYGSSFNEFINYNYYFKLQKFLFLVLNDSLSALWIWMHETIKGLAVWSFL